MSYATESLYLLKANIKPSSQVFLQYNSAHIFILLRQRFSHTEYLSPYICRYFLPPVHISGCKDCTAVCGHPRWWDVDSGLVTITSPAAFSAVVWPPQNHATPRLQKYSSVHGNRQNSFADRIKRILYPHSHPNAMCPWSRALLTKMIIA
jgi:hypothetical protein